MYFYLQNLGFFLLFKLNTEIIVMIRIFFVGRDFLIYIYILKLYAY